MSTTEALIRFLYVRLPRGLAPLLPRIAAGIGDGGWMAVWGPAAAWTPLLVFGIGLVVPRTWPGTEIVYTEAPVFLALAPALGILNGTWGVALLLANGLREGLSHDMASGLDAVLHVGAGQFVAWLLLGVLVVQLPQFAHLVTEAIIVRLPWLRQRDMRAVCRALVLALIFPGLVLVWCQAMTLLAPPVFTWSGQAAPAGAIPAPGDGWLWLAGVVAGAALARGLLEGLVAPRLDRAADAAALARDRDAPAPRAAWRGMPEALRTAGGAAVMLLLLAGLFDDPVVWLIAGLVLGLLTALSQGLGGWLTGTWGSRMRLIPGALRVAAALGAGVVVTALVAASGGSGQATRAPMWGSLLALALFFVFFPAVAARSPRPAARRV